MPFRFFRRFKVAPGVTMNLSKSGPSLSFGPRGAKVTVGSKGVRKTIGAPGTGLFYTEHSSWGSSKGRKGQGGSVPDSSNQAMHKLDLGFFKRIFTPKNEQDFVDGLKAYIQGNEVLALEKLSQCGEMADSLFMAGFIALKKEKYDLALKLFKQAYVNMAGLGQTFSKYGLDLTLSLPLTHDIDAFIKPRLRGLLLGMAEAHKEQKNMLQALEVLKELRDLEPKDVVIKVSLTELLLEVSPDDPMVLKDIVQMTADVRNDSSAHAALMLYKARALKGLKMYVPVRDTLTAALRKKKDRSQEILMALQYERALIYEAMGNKTRYRQDMEKLFVLDPGYEDVAERLGIG